LISKTKDPTSPEKKQVKPPVKLINNKAISEYSKKKGAS